MRRAAVLGHPISHSLSPVLHRAAYRALGLDWGYEAIDVTEAQLPGFLAGLDDSWAGLSLTMPLKQSVLPHLAVTSPTVAATGSANTVLVTSAGLEGHNTDVFGIVKAVQLSPGFDAPGTVAIIGSGATAASALVAAGELSAHKVTVCARRPEAVAELVGRGRAAGVPAVGASWTEVEAVFRSDVVVCTLPGDAGAGLAGDVPSMPGLLLDVTYDPWPTTLAAAWIANGGNVVPGHQMLLWQAVRQVLLMTGRDAPVPAMAAALDAAINRE